MPCSGPHHGLDAGAIDAPIRQAVEDQCRKRGALGKAVEHDVFVGRVDAPAHHAQRIHVRHACRKDIVALTDTAGVGKFQAEPDRFACGTDGIEQCLLGRISRLRGTVEAAVKVAMDTVPRRRALEKALARAGGGE